jgi:hypothetical protein
MHFSLYANAELNIFMKVKSANTHVVGQIWLATKGSMNNDKMIPYHHSILYHEAVDIADSFQVHQGADYDQQTTVKI